MSFSIPALAIADVPKFAWQWKEEIHQNQLPVVQNTWYTLIDEDEGVKIHQVCFMQDNDEENAANIEVEVVIDGVTFTFAGSLGWDVGRWLYLTSISPDETETYLGIITAPCFLHGTRDYSASNEVDSQSLRGHAIRIRYRQTSVVGTNPEIDAVCSYSKKEAV